MKSKKHTVHHIRTIVSRILMKLMKKSFKILLLLLLVINVLVVILLQISNSNFYQQYFC